METDPLDIGVQQQAGPHELLPELNRVDPVLPEQVELESRLPEQINWVILAQVVVNIVLEVELPSADALGLVAQVVAEGDAELDEFEGVHVGFEGVVLEFGVDQVLVGVFGEVDYSGEFGVEADHVELFG